ncbi:protein SLOW GREEN 1, chloroplastic-like [Vicia villosa]|uniref:protein SLOW GREEN 1, chloroplastic-like n=1 Tax=Vicia villosa TaxID=3911 RepID=UPI00273BAE64|nr:protein SLOW GREEN 1, chloroplastic-like [Vicia villosa]
MDSQSVTNLRHSNLSLNPNRSSFPSPLSSSLSFRSLPPPQFLPPPSLKLQPIRASSSPNDPAFHQPRNLPPLPNPFQALTSLFSPVVKTTCIILAATAFFFTRFHHSPVIAATLATPASVETSPEAENENASEGEQAEKLIEERLSQNPNDAEALRSLMEVKIKARKVDEAIGIINRLIEIEPEEMEWPLLKANMYIYNDDHETAKKLFEEILQRDPLRVEAYHGLVMASSDSSESNEPSNETMKGLLQRVEKALELCKKQKRVSDVRDFRLLVAQIKVMEGNFSEALKAYQELVKEEPRDFRPYLCQGIIYTLLRKKDEAEKQFDQFRRLIPKNHPYREYFDDNMYGTNFFAPKFESERAGARS